MDDSVSKIYIHSLNSKHQGYGRLGHNAICRGDQILLLGGTNHLAQYSPSILKFNLITYKFDELLAQNNLNIQGFCSFCWEGVVYLWGGNIQSDSESRQLKVTNKLWFFDGHKFKACKQNGSIPPARAFHSSVFFDHYLLIFGGFSNFQIFADWYIFNLISKQWKRVEPSFHIPLASSAKIGWINGRGYLLLSQFVTVQQSSISISQNIIIYEIKITDFNHPRLKIDLIDTIGEGPPPRAHPTLFFKGKYIFLMGGQSFAFGSQTLFDDVWRFDVEVLSWKRLDISLNVNLGFEAIGYQNKVFLFGGMIKGGLFSQNVQILSLLEEKKVCEVCANIYLPFSMERQSEGKKYRMDKVEEKIELNGNFLQKLSRMIDHPFHAIALLIDNSFNMDSTFLSISLHSSKINYLLIGDNSKSATSSLLKTQLSTFWYESNSNPYKIENQVNCYAINLLLAGLKLGKSFLFVTETMSGEKCVASFNIEEEEKQFAFYSMRGEEQIFRKGNPFWEEEYLDTSFFSTKIYIFKVEDLKIKNSSDIVGRGVYESNEKLSSYLSKLYYPPFIGRQIFVQKQKISFFNFLDQFKHDEGEGKLEMLDCADDESLFKRIVLYKIIYPNYPMDGVYIYHKGRLIRVVWTIEKQLCGLVQIPDQISVNIFKNEIENYSDLRQLKHFLDMKETKKRRKSISGKAVDAVRKQKKLNID